MRTGEAAAPRKAGTYRAALAVGEFRAIALGFLISILGDSAAALAVTVLMYQRTGSSLLAALTWVCAFGPYLIGGTLLSGLVDRITPRAMMAGSDLIGAGLVALIAIRGVPIPLIYVVLVIIGLIAPLRSGASSTVVSAVLPGDAFVPGRSLLRMAAQGAQILGAALGGGLVGAFGPRGALVADTASYMISALLIVLFVRARATNSEPRAKGLVKDSLSGIRDVLALRPVRRVLFLNWVVSFVSVAPEALAAPAVSHAGYSAGFTGLWLAAAPLGFVVGDVLAITFVPQQRLVRWIFPMAVAGTSVLLIFVLWPPLPVMVALLVCNGVSSIYGLGTDRSLRDDTPPDLLGRMFSLSSTGLMAIQGLGFGVAGALGEVMSPGHVIAALALLGLVGVVAIARIDDSSAS